MKAFDTDILSDLFHNVPKVVARFAQVPVADQRVPIGVAEEILRGRLDAIRKAQSGVKRYTVERAYEEFEKSLNDLKQFRLLSYSTPAETVFKVMVASKIRVGSRDLRIAATCIAHTATLVTRNRRDFEQVPGLDLEVWS